MNRVTIEDIVRETGVSRRTIRYYVAMGYLDHPLGRGPSACYAPDTCGRIREIRKIVDGRRAMTIPTHLTKRQ